MRTIAGTGHWSMLRVGLTGALGSGKSTVASMLAARGAVVFSSDEMARAMMQPDQPVYAAIVERFGAGVVRADGSLDRHVLARLAFDEANPRVEELNAIIHPAVIAEQARLIDKLAETKPHAIVVVESALLLTTRHAGSASWRSRFDVMVLVTAPEESLMERFVARTAGAAGDDSAARAEARRRLAAQRWTPEQERDCVVVRNEGSLVELGCAVDSLWSELVRREQANDAVAAL